MTRYHSTLGTVRISELQREKRARSWQLTLATIRIYFNNRWMLAALWQVAAVISLAAMTAQATA